MLQALPKVVGTTTVLAVQHTWQSKSLRVVTVGKQPVGSAEMGTASSFWDPPACSMRWDS